MLLILGCGGSNGTPKPTTGSLTKAEFLKKGNAICAQGNEEINAVYGKYADAPPGEAKMNQVAQEVVPPVRAKVVKRLRALGAPSGEEERVEKIFDAIEEGVKKGEEDAASLRASGPRYAFWRAYNLEIDYGLERCALD